MEARSKRSNGFIQSSVLRLALWALAGGLGLWLGAGTRPAAAGKVAVQQQNPGKTLLADSFRFDVLLSRTEPAAEAGEQSAAVKPAQESPAPAAVVFTQSEPVATVEAPLCASLELRMPQRIHPNVRPGRPPQPPALHESARLLPADAHLEAILKQIPGFKPADMRAIQAKVKCERVRAGVDLQVFVTDLPPAPPEPPAPPIATSEAVETFAVDASPQCKN